MNVPKTRPQHHQLPAGFACGVGLDDGSIADRLKVPGSSSISATETAAPDAAESEFEPARKSA